ncbi:MAG TPA: NB-ARC domain-containing protein, partial [Thermoanaerobaculia bacterium]|nr:NB-ARC domain-containing protein [Thermoanaerobaculia bacterium]
MRSVPVPLTSLLGRERELAETERLLAGTRLLTLTGAGGSGKTRLALELARRATQRFDDAVWIDLAPIDDADLIPEQLLGALGLREVPDAEDVEVIVAALEPRHALLVFDNCEHVVDASAALAETILRRCPAVSILATTREALGITGEQTWLVPPLAEQDAMQLFAERARSVSPSFALTNENTPAVSNICQRLDGIPLAIELAAARVKVLPVEQIAARLADAFRLLSSGSRTLPRHRTIRETIDWSFRLLSEDEQILLRRLAVFSGSFSLAAAEAICDDVDVLSGVAALVDKSLLMVADDGYRLLETVRQFAAEKLQQARETGTFRERHARYFSQLVESAEPRLFAGAVDLPTMAAIDREIGNIRAVFEWAEEEPSRAELELRLIYALHWYWFARGHFHEARRRIDAAVARLKTANVDPLVKARAFIAHGDAAEWQADWDAIRPSIDEAVEILRDSGDTRALSM